MGYRKDIEGWERRELKGRVLTLIVVGVICYGLGLYTGLAAFTPLDF